MIFSPKPAQWYSFSTYMTVIPYLYENVQPVADAKRIGVIPNSTKCINKIFGSIFNFYLSLLNISSANDLGQCVIV